MWVTAAPARAASITASAICFGVTGIEGCFPTVSPAPVTAQVTITSVFTPSSPPDPPRCRVVRRSFKAYGSAAADATMVRRDGSARYRRLQNGVMEGAQQALGSPVRVIPAHQVHRVGEAGAELRPGAVDRAAGARV